MDDDFFRDSDKGKREKDNLFGWTVFILLLIGAAFAAWLGTYRIFGHPENAKSYAILRKLDKIDPPKQFQVTSAPAGEFLSPEKLYDKYALFTTLELKRENEVLLRNYLRNFQETKKLVPYVIGRFNIVESKPLGPETMFESGYVALAVPTDYPRVVLEHVFPAGPESSEVLGEMLKPGLDLRFQRSLDLSAVIHIERLQDGRLMFTAVPLLYGSYALKQGQGSFSLEPPAELNVEAGVPLMKPEETDEALRRYVTRMAASRVSIAHNDDPMNVDGSPTPVPQPELVRAATPTPTPEGTSPTPTPIAVAQTTPVVPRSTPVRLAANAAPTPAPTVAAAVAVAAATPATTGGVELQPFLVSRQRPDQPGASGGSWPVYSPGSAPQGRLVELDALDEVATTGVDGRTYLGGSFVVTASGGNRAVLRSLNNAAAARVMVTFPSGATPPREGAQILRDKARPLQIVDVRKGQDGVLTAYVREITVGE